MLRSSYYMLAVLLMVLALVSCSMNDSTPTSTSPNTVIIMDNSFSPQTLAVVVGRLVVWKNEGNNSHTVTSGTPTSNPGSIFDSGILAPGGGFTFAFSQAGQYSYFCKIHGASMSGIIIVQ